MSDNRMSEEIPVITGNHLPFRLVLRDSDEEWKLSLDQINALSYDYVKLHRASTFLDIGIAPWSLGVCFDGTLVLPATKEYCKPENALACFNKVLCAILLGGTYCEAMSPDDVSRGLITPTLYCRILTPSGGPVAGFHAAIRTKHVGLMESIRLLHPKTIRTRTLENAYSVGRQRLCRLGATAPETLLLLRALNSLHMMVTCFYSAAYRTDFSWK